MSSTQAHKGEQRVEYERMVLPIHHYITFQKIHQFITFTVV